MFVVIWYVWCVGYYLEFFSLGNDSVDFVFVVVFFCMSIVLIVDVIGC